MHRKLTHLSVNPEGSRLLVQLNGGHSRHLSGLLNVTAVASDGETHEVISHSKLVLKRRGQLLRTLQTQRFSHFNPGLILSELHTSHINNQENRMERADLPPDVWWPPRSGTRAGVWCVCCVNACHSAGRRAWRRLRSWTVLGNIMLIKILSFLNLLTKVQRLTGTHQYSQFTLFRAVNNPNGSDRLFEILVGFFILTPNMGKEQMSAWF